MENKYKVRWYIEGVDGDELQAGFICNEEYFTDEWMEENEVIADTFTTEKEAEKAAEHTYEAHKKQTGQSVFWGVVDDD